MDPISDFCAAPHLPPSLRERTIASVRPECALVTLAAASQLSGEIVVQERNGEIYVTFANAA